MPMHEYRCRACGHEFEKLVRMAEADRVACEACESEDTERCLSVFGVGAGKAGGPPCADGRCDMRQCPDNACCCAPPE